MGIVDSYLRFAERYCEWFLERRGRYVLRRAYNGFVVGNGIATQDAKHPEIWTLVFMTDQIQICAISNSVVIKAGQISEETNDAKNFAS